MSRLSRHLPQVIALAIAIIAAAGAYGLSKGQLDKPSPEPQRNIAGVEDDSAQPQVTPASDHKITERRAPTSTTRTTQRSASTGTDAPLDEPAAGQTVRPREDEHHTSPREDRHGIRQPAFDDDALDRELKRIIDEPAVAPDPTTPGAAPAPPPGATPPTATPPAATPPVAPTSSVGAAQPVAPTAPLSPSAATGAPRPPLPAVVPADPAGVVPDEEEGQGQGAGEGSTSAEGSPLGESISAGGSAIEDDADTAISPALSESADGNANPDDQVGNADDEDAGADEQDGEVEDESPISAGGPEGADADAPENVGSANAPLEP